MTATAPPPIDPTPIRLVVAALVRHALTALAVYLGMTAKQQTDLCDVLGNAMTATIIAIGVQVWSHVEQRMLRNMTPPTDPKA